MEPYEWLTQNILYHVISGIGLAEVNSSSCEFVIARLSGFDSRSCSFLGKQECIPMECLPPACRPYPSMHCPGVSAQGSACRGCLPRAVCLPRGVSAQGMSAQVGGVCLGGVCHPPAPEADNPPRGQTPVKT